MISIIANKYSSYQSKFKIVCSFDQNDKNSNLTKDSVIFSSMIRVITIHSLLPNQCFKKKFAMIKCMTWNPWNTFLFGEFMMMTPLLVVVC